MTELQVSAAKIAGGWHRFFGARHVIEKDAAPWQRPTAFEVEAAGGEDCCTAGGAGVAVL